ncbi:MAG: DUF3160 domain-containing protein [Actinomycetia bacterium]|nr:DUF3160 domain-containing protein [Actinomycetes bacterium]
MKNRAIPVVMSGVLALAACTSGGRPPSRSDSSASPTPSPSPVVLALPAARVGFAVFEPVELTPSAGPTHPGPATPTSLEGVQVVDAIRAQLADPAVRDTLVRQGFVVIPADYRLLQDAYAGNQYQGWPTYVTTDAAYHVWHLTFDKLLRSLEQETLLPTLDDLVTQLLQRARAQAKELAGTPLADTADRVEQYYQVVFAALGHDVQLGALARQEKTLIDEHAQATTSPLLGTTVNYTMMTPRGHYTRNTKLTRYFTAMSVLGQLAFCLPGTLDCTGGVVPTRLGLLAVRSLVSDSTLIQQWRLVYEPTAFFVGLADDYTPTEAAAAARGVVPGWLADPAPLASDETVREIADRLLALRPVQIDEARASIRVMGTRFVVDSYILDQLVAPFVGTEGDWRTMASALDVAAALGSPFALGVLAETGQTEYENYARQMAALRASVRTRPAAAWGGTVYDAWLYAVQPAVVAHGTAFPDYMRTPAWAAKSLQSGLGSYAQLKHDTILYAKQALVEGGDGELPPTPRSWVEPDPVVFTRLAAAADLARRGLGERDLLTSSQEELLADVTGLFAFLGRVSTDELAGRPVSDKDNERLGDIGAELESLWLRTSDRAADGGSVSQDEDSAVIADILTGASGEVLEVGTGRFDRILVLVPDDDGTFQVAAGGVFSYYEFVNAGGQRLTDEAWRALLDKDPPDRPDWQAPIFAR